MPDSPTVLQDNVPAYSEAIEQLRRLQAPGAKPRRGQGIEVRRFQAQKNQAIANIQAAAGDATAEWRAPELKAADAAV